MNGPLKRMLQSRLEALASDPEQLPGLAEYAQVVATIEHELALQATELAELAGTAPPPMMDPEARAQQLVDLAGSLMGESTGELYVRAMTDVEDEAAAQAAAYLGLGRDGWADQVDEWTAAMRERGAPEDAESRELLEAYTEGAFGVGPDVFRGQVALVEPHEAERRLFQHRFDAIHDANEAALAALQDERDAEA